MDDAPAPSTHVHINCPTRTDPSLAPPGCHVLIVNVERQRDAKAGIELLERPSGIIRAEQADCGPANHLGTATPGRQMPITGNKSCGARHGAIRPSRFSRELCESYATLAIAGSGTFAMRIVRTLVFW